MISMDVTSCQKQMEEEKPEPMTVMVDEQTGETFARTTGRKGEGCSGQKTGQKSVMGRGSKRWEPQHLAK